MKYRKLSLYSLLPCLCLVFGYYEILEVNSYCCWLLLTLNSLLYLFRVYIVSTPQYFLIIRFTFEGWMLTEVAKGLIAHFAFCHLVFRIWRIYGHSFTLQLSILNCLTQTMTKNRCQSPEQPVSLEINHFSVYMAELSHYISNFAELWTH